MLLNEEYRRIARGIENISHDQAKSLIRTLLNRLKKETGAIIVDLWVHIPGDQVDILQLYVTDNDDRRQLPRPISLTSQARGLLAWVADKRRPLWLNEIPEQLTISDTTICVDKICGEEVTGRFLRNIYDRTHEFASVPIEFLNKLRGVLTIEIDRKNSIEDYHIELMRDLIEPTGIIIWKAYSCEARGEQTNQVIEAFTRIALNSSLLPLNPHRTGFIARPFGSEFDPVESAIKEIFRTHGVKATSYLHRPGAGLVVNELLRQIRSAHFGIADITNMNINVLIELGAMMSSDRPFLIIQDHKWADGQDTTFNIQGYQCYSYFRRDGSIMILEPNSNPQHLEDFVDKFIKGLWSMNPAFREAREYHGR